MSLANEPIFPEMTTHLDNSTRLSILDFARQQYDDKFTKVHEELFALLVDTANTLILAYQAESGTLPGAVVTTLQGLEENIDIRLDAIGFQWPTEPFRFTVEYKPETTDGEPWLIVNDNDKSFSFWPSLDEALIAIRGEATSEQLGETD